MTKGCTIDKLAKIVYNADGSFRGFVTERDRLEWAYLTAGFAEAHVCTNRNERKDFYNTCQQNDLKEFAQVQGWQACFTRRSLKKQHQQREGVPKNKIMQQKQFNADYIKCTRAMETGNLRSMKLIVEKYRAKAHESATAFEQAKALRQLFEMAGGTIENIHPADLDRHTTESITRADIPEKVFNEAYMQCTRAIEAGDLQTARSIAEHYREQAHESPQMQKHAQIISDLYTHAGGTFSSPAASSSSSSSAGASSSSSGTGVTWPGQTEAAKSELITPSDEIATDMTAPGAERYSVVEYMKETDAILAKMEKGPAQIAATQIRDFLETQWQDLQTEGKLLLEQTGRIGDLTLEQVDFILDRALCKAFGIPIGDLTPAQESSFGEKANFIKEKVNDLAQGIGHVLKVHAESLQQDMAHFDIPRFTELAQKGNIEEARSVLAEHISGNQRFQAILGKIKENLSHPVAFIGNVTRGTLGMLDIAKNITLEPLMSELRTPAEQQVALAQYAESFNDFTKKLQSLTSRELEQLTAHIAADIITLDAFKSAYSAIRSGTTATSGGASSSSGTGIVPHKEQLPVTQRRTFDLRGKGKGKSIDPKTIAAQKARQQSGASSSSSSKSEASESVATKEALQSVQTAFHRAVSVERQTIFKEVIRTNKDLRDFYNIFGKEVTMEAMESVFHDCKTPKQFNKAWRINHYKNDFKDMAKCILKLNSQPEWIQQKYNANGQILKLKRESLAPGSSCVPAIKERGLFDGVDKISILDLQNATTTISQFAHSRENPIWQKIEPTGGFEVNTVIPRGFRININDQKIWIKPHATKHLTENIGMPTGMKETCGSLTAATGQILASEVELCKFYDILEQAIQQGLQDNVLMKVGDWQFKFDLKHKIPELYHALYKGS